MPFFRYSINEYPPSRYLFNPIRIVQALLCLGCLGLAIYLIIEEPLLHLAFKVILGVTAAAFATITVIDVISNTHYDPVNWSTWANVALTGALFFFLCTGLLFATYTGVTTNLIVGEILFGVTGIVFLIDAIYLLCAERKKQVRPLMGGKTIVRSHTRIVDAGYVSEENIETIHGHYEGQNYAPCVPPYEPPSPPRTPPPCAPQQRKPICRCATPTYSDTCYMSQDAGDVSEEKFDTMHEHYEDQMCPPCCQSYEPPPPPPRRPPPCAPPLRKQSSSRSPTTTTYGGTFYMSKDATPLPSPEPTVRTVCRSRSEKDEEW